MVIGDGDRDWNSNDYYSVIGKGKEKQYTSSSLEEEFESDLSEDGIDYYHHTYRRRRGGADRSHRFDNRSEGRDCVQVWG